jgi:hypothetical protein
MKIRTRVTFVLMIWMVGPIASFAEEESIAAFRAIMPVFQSPRCMNCHTVTSFPRQGDDRHRHSMNVVRGVDGHGAPALRCSTCHQRANQTASGVPGAAEDWRLAPLSMGWEDLSAGELCRRLLDTSANGGRSGSAVMDHLSTNLVCWAWTPGGNSRGVVRRSPPLSYDEFIHLAHRWIETGAKCPQ